MNRSLFLADLSVFQRPRIGSSESLPPALDVVASVTMPEGSPDPLSFYTRRAQEVQLSAEQINERRGKWLAVSVLLAALTLVLLYRSFTKKTPYWSAIFPLAAVALALRQTQHYRSEVLKLVTLREYYDKGIARLKRDWDSLDEGNDFVDSAHIYSTDLDLFGRGSLFQLLCSARTHLGRETLASWMKSPASKEEVLARRAAIFELRGRRELLESVAAAGTTSFSNCRQGTFKNWVAEMSSFSPFPAWAPVLAFLLASILIALPLFYWAGSLGLQNVWVSIGVVLALELALAGLLQKRVRSVIASVQMPSIELPIICELLRIIERESFSSMRLVGLVSRLKNRQYTASNGLRRLNRFVRLLDQRDNPVLTLFLWGTQLSMPIDRWYRRHGADLLEYLSSLGEFDALLSLSAYAFEHPQDVFPELVDQAPVFNAKQLGHPLLDETVCVRNDIFLDANARFLIVSGSNMSGKSTFLRAIGTNGVLAWMGALVRCVALRLSKLQIAASIGIQDSVTDGSSHFLAEMQRLRRMIDLAGEGPVLFLADEIMSGTNSRDRRIAAEWVIRALVRRNAVGLITTHDLTLTEIAANGLPGRNVYFEDSGEGGDLKFDYKLHSGLLTHSNALNIVRMLGIDTET